MAAKNSKKPATQPTAGPQPAPEPKKPQVASFDAFNGEEVNVPDIDGWYNPEEGEAGWVGRIVGQFKMTNDDGKERDVVVVRLLSDCSSATIEGEPVSLEAGQVMAVSIRAKLMGLLDYIEKHGIVAVRAVEKKQIAKGRSMWVFNIKGQPGARVPRDQARQAPAPGSSTMNSGDVPW